MKEYTRKHSGATLFGIYWTLFFSFLQFLLGLYFIIYVFYYYSAEALALGIPLVLFSFLALFFGLKFYKGKTRDYVLVGLVSLISSFIGGLFILFDGKRSVKQFYAQSDEIKTHDNLEYKLKEIEGLRQRGIISKEEYDAKRSQIISQY
jgi:hypothetical protein